ncbi:hypothetical protein RFI_00481, partial [Reticulomyxa filosa]
LGIGTRANQRFPVQIKVEGDSDFSKIRCASCGDRHTICITESGQLFSFGSGEHGQLGHNDNHDQYVPKKIDFFSKNRLKVKQGDCGSIHTAVICENGELYIFGFGENLYGKNKKNFNYEPVHIPFKYKIALVKSGQYFYCDIIIYVYIFFEIKTKHLKKKKIIRIWQNKAVTYTLQLRFFLFVLNVAFRASQHPRLILYGKNITCIAAGRYHSSAVSNIGALYTWGCGDNGQLARQEDRLDNYNKRANSVAKLVVSLLGNVVGQVSCGEHHTCVLACMYRVLSFLLPSSKSEGDNNNKKTLAICKEMEFQAKLNLLSSAKQKGRGISKKDLKTKRAMRKTRRNKKIKEELAKIETDESLRNASNPEITTFLPSETKPSKKQTNEVLCRIYLVCYEALLFFFEMFRLHCAIQLQVTNDHMPTITKSPSRRKKQHPVHRNTSSVSLENEIAKLKRARQLTNT